MKELFKKIIIRILTWEARVIIKRAKPTIIAITGNLGKTSTKDFIYAALAKNLKNEKGEELVLASKKSMNSEFGVPLTILQLETGWNNPLEWLKIVVRGFIKTLDRYHYKYLVLEIGADAPDDIKKITEYIKPDIAVLTAFAKVPVHIEFFDNDRNRLIREKKYLFEALKPGGTMIYNLDDADCLKMAEEFKDKDIILKSFSLKTNQADIFLTNRETNIQEINKYIDKLIGSEAQINFKDGRAIKIILNEVLGEAVYYNLLPSLLIADILEIEIDKAITQIENSKRTKGRMHILEGIYKTNLIDDTYNASPKAVENAISIVKDLKIKGKKIFILGDMLELGDYTRDEHTRIGELVSKVADILITAGIRAKIIGESAIQNGMNGENVYILNNSIEAGREILRILEKEVEEDYKAGRSESEVGGGLILIKGSQGSRMEKAVKMILAKNHQPEEHLVRQEKDWLNR